MPPAAKPPGSEAAAPPKPPEIPPTVDLESPAFKEALRKHGEAEAAKAAAAARLAALTEAKEAAEEEKRVAALSAEERARHERDLLKSEATAAKGAATKAENQAAAAAREAAIFRQLATAGMVPQDDDVAAMIAASAPATIVPGDTGWLTKLAAAKPYLFKAPPEPKPGTASPAEIVGAGKSTAPAAAAAPATNPGGKVDAYSLNDEQWKARQRELGLKVV